MTTGDWVQVAGLAINAGLLGGLIVELRFVSRSRHQDVAAQSQRATLGAMRVLWKTARDAEETIQAIAAELRWRLCRWRSIGRA